MELFPISDVSQGQNPFPTSDRSADLDRDDFLQLLVAQLANQDPTNPQEGHEFAAQLAQFSSVEQLANISGTLAVHSEQLAILSEGTAAAAGQQIALASAINDRTTLTAATALIGQTVEAEGNTTVFNGTDPSALSFSLAAPASDVTITIRDASGAVVRTVSPGHLGEGAHVPTWDGLDDKGDPVEPGAYTFEVKATDTDGEAVEATTFTRGRVDRISIDEDGPRLWIGPFALALDDVISVIP
ncbi:MAG: FlgD immunoglobulin-like domain containing protein [Bacteroidota bacterium]